MRLVPDSDRGSAGAPSDGVDWDARYAASEQVWSGNPNSALVAEMTGDTPGTAVDVGSGEGADAIYEERPRHVTTGAGAGHNLDLVLRARRNPPAQH